MKLLLDTCTFLWAAADDPRLSDRAREAYRDPDNDVHLSAVSAWEIGIQVALGRLTLPAPAGRFVPEARERLRIAPLPFDEEAALAVPRLPEVHRDPFDRALVAQAVVRGLSLVTPDEEIARYPVRVVW